MNPNTYSFSLMFWRKTPATRKHRPTPIKRTRLLRQAKTHSPPPVRRARPRLVSHKFTVTNRIGNLRIWPTTRYLAVVGAYKTYNAALGFAAAVRQHLPFTLSLNIAKTPRILSSALATLPQRWNHLSTATTSLIFNNMVRLGRNPAGLLAMPFIAPAAKVFSWIARLGQPMQPPLAANANPTPAVQITTPRVKRRKAMAATA